MDTMELLLLEKSFQNMSAEPSWPRFCNGLYSLLRWKGRVQRGTG